MPRHILTGLQWAPIENLFRCHSIVVEESSTYEISLPGALPLVLKPTTIDIFAIHYNCMLSYKGRAFGQRNNTKNKANFTLRSCKDNKL